MIKTYKASEVRLAEPLTGVPTRTLVASEFESLVIDPSSCQVFATTTNGNTMVARYTQATFAAGEYEKAVICHQCDVCGQLFETAQGLAGHRRIHEPPTPPQPFGKTGKR